MVGDRNGRGGVKDGDSNSDWVRAGYDGAEELFTKDSEFADWVVVAPTSELFAYHKMDRPLYENGSYVIPGAPAWAQHGVGRAVWSMWNERSPAAACRSPCGAR